MVRILRNDAPPRQTVNLLSDEERGPSDSSSSASSNSSSSSNSSTSSSSDSDERPAKPSPPPLSDFIEEDDGPRPVLRSSTSSWEPVKCRRKRLKTLRKKPRLDKVDADDEDSTSTTSTSSEGIPRPEIEADADDEEGEEEAPKPRRVPSKRRRPRRAAAPPCFLDAVNKFVEPMSKEANKYRNRTLSQILYGDSNDQDPGNASDDSSVEYVLYPPPKNAASTDSGSEERKEMEGGKFASGSGNRQSDEGCTPNRPTRVRRRTRNRETSPTCPASPVQCDVGEPSDGEVQASRGCPSSIRSPMQRDKSSLPPDSSGTEEDEPLSTVLDRKRSDLRALNNHRPTQQYRRKGKHSKLQNAEKVINAQKTEGEVIDLCSDDEQLAPKDEDEVNRISTTTAHRQSDSVAGYGARERDLNAVVHNQSHMRNLEEAAKDQSSSMGKSTSCPKTEEPCSNPQEGFPYECDDRTNASNCLGSNARMIKVGKNHLSALFRLDQNPQEDSKVCVEDPKRPNPSQKIKSYPQVCEDDFAHEHIMEPSKNREILIKDAEDRKSPDMDVSLDHKQSNNVFACNSNGKNEYSNFTKVGSWQKRRFKGAKQRGNTRHPDVIKSRVPESKADRAAWLEFTKAEARDIYRAFTADAPARKFKCANTDMVFVRQILGELGKMMGLQVSSEREGAGRRLILEKVHLGPVKGSEKEVEQAVESFFDDALADLTDQSEKLKHQRKTRSTSRKNGAKANNKVNSITMTKGGESPGSSPLPVASRDSSSAIDF